MVSYMKSHNYNVEFNTRERMFYITSKTSDVVIGGFAYASEAIEMAETRVSK